MNDNGRNDWKNSQHPFISRRIYYLRILITKLKEPQNFDESLTVEGKKYQDFKSSCYAKSLLDSLPAVGNYESNYQVL